MPLRRLLVVAGIVAGVTAIAVSGANTSTVRRCAPTPYYGGGEYLAGAPVRTRVGHGHVLRGFVRSSRDCRPIARARMEFFQAGPDGEYSDGITSWAYRATLFSRRDGSYRFEGPFPGKHLRYPPHIHFRVSARGYRWIMGHYTVPAGERLRRLDVVLVPNR